MADKCHRCGVKIGWRHAKKGEGGLLSREYCVDCTREMGLEKRAQEEQRKEERRQARRERWGTAPAAAAAERERREEESARAEVRPATSSTGEADSSSHPASAVAYRAESLQAAPEMPGPPTPTPGPGDTEPPTAPAAENEGRLIPAKTSEQVSCVACGRAITAVAAFCYRCGSPQPGATLDQLAAWYWPGRGEVEAARVGRSRSPSEHPASGPSRTSGSESPPALEPPAPTPTPHGVEADHTRRLAKASLIFGLLAIPGLALLVLPGVAAGIGALVLGARARSRAKERGEARSGIAGAGMILGAFALATTLALSMAVAFLGDFETKTATVPRVRSSPVAAVSPPVPAQQAAPAPPPPPSPAPVEIPPAAPQARQVDALTVRGYRVRLGAKADDVFDAFNARGIKSFGTDSEVIGYFEDGYPAKRVTHHYSVDGVTFDLVFEPLDGTYYVVKQITVR